MSEAVEWETIKSSLIERHTASVYHQLIHAKVAIAGLGGLGSNIAVFLARAGVGELFLVDFDTVELSNINRQQYQLKHIGMKKTDAILDILKNINPYLTYRTECVRVTNQNAVQLFQDYPIICEAFDVAENKAMLTNEIMEHCTNNVIITGSGMAGYDDANEIKTKKITKRFYLCGDAVTDKDAANGLMAPRVSICAGHQANLVLQLILGGKKDE